MAPRSGTPSETPFQPVSLLNNFIIVHVLISNLAAKLFHVRFEDDTNDILTLARVWTGFNYAT